MIYTIKDLKNRKVILEYDNQKSTKKVLKVTFNEKFSKNEGPAYNHYVSDGKGDYIAFDDNDLSDSKYWNLNANGTRSLPSYLIGYKTMSEYYKCEDLPKQKASLFKIK